jgi:EAL domain-containing protein (putative c-di-GMP-specific phosphodiesterase class I)
VKCSPVLVGVIAAGAYEHPATPFSPNQAEGDDSAMVQTIITLARGMKLQVVAEGIEDERQLALLRRLCCDYGQGYLFSHPLDSEAASALLAAIYAGRFNIDSY